MSGWIALPTFSRSQSDLQFAFLNGRFVRDKLIAGAARLAYQDVLFGGRFCAYVLYLDMDPTLVDVNAHPQKLEVRFREARSVHEFMFRTLERALADTRPTAESPGSAPLDWLAAERRASRALRRARRDSRCPSGRPRRALEGYWQLLSSGAARRGDRGERGVADQAVREEARAGAARGRAAPRLRGRAAARRIHLVPDRGRAGAGGHACGARAGDVRAHEGLVGRRDGAAAACWCPRS